LSPFLFLVFLCIDCLGLIMFFSFYRESNEGR
jgi:hypothetical protein